MTPRKQETIRRLAAQYITERAPVFEEARFDVVGMLESGPEPAVRHIQGAF